MKPAATVIYENHKEHGVEWLEVKITVEAEAAEAVAEVLSRYAPQGVAVDLGAASAAEKVTVRAYLACDETLAGRQQQVEEGLWHLSQIWPMPAPVFTAVPEEDWTAAWRETLSVLHLGRRIVIKPSWRTYASNPARPDEVILELDPGQAFGTGLHPTTQLCVEALERLVRPGMRVLDLGTGTGILALAAAKLVSPVEVLAVDNDPNAIAVARRNLGMNDASAVVRLLHGSLGDVSGTYDLILANILAPVIIEMAQHGLGARLRTGGRLIASGILAEQQDEVVAALRQNGLELLETQQRGDWVALIAERARLV